MRCADVVCDDVACADVRWRGGCADVSLIYLIVFPIYVSYCTVYGVPRSNLLPSCAGCGYPEARQRALALHALVWRSAGVFFFEACGKEDPQTRMDNYIGMFESVNVTVNVIMSV